MTVAVDRYNGSVRVSRALTRSVVAGSSAHLDDFEIRRKSARFPLGPEVLVPLGAVVGVVARSAANRAGVARAVKRLLFHLRRELHRERPATARRAPARGVGRLDGHVRWQRGCVVGAGDGQSNEKRYEEEPGNPLGHGSRDDANTGPGGSRVALLVN